MKVLPPPIADNSVIIQEAINSVIAAGGGTLLVPATPGGYRYSRDLIIPASNFRLLGEGPVASKLIYTGNGSALTFGSRNSDGYRCEISTLTVDLQEAGNQAIGLNLIRQQFFKSYSLEVQATNGSPAPKQQIGVKCDGAGHFGAMIDLYSPHISGDLLYGLVTTADPGHQCNAVSLFGGGVYQTSASKAGTKGWLVQRGDTSRAWDTDFEDWAVGIEVQSNFNGPFAARFEANLNAWSVLSGVLNTSFMGATFDNTFKDLGVRTQYSSNGAWSGMVMPPIKTQP